VTSNPRRQAARERAQDAGIQVGRTSGNHHEPAGKGYTDEQLMACRLVRRTKTLAMRSRQCGCDDAIERAGRRLEPWSSRFPGASMSSSAHGKWWSSAVTDREVKYIRLWSDGAIDVTLVEPDASFISCPLSNWCWRQQDPGRHHRELRRPRAQPA
jgi:hypothetical protein